MIERKAGCGFFYGEVLSGEIIELKQDERIVLFWRTEDWPKGYYSKVTYPLNPLTDGRRTKLSLVQTGVPEDTFDDINHGWRNVYWTKMADYFRDESAALVRRFIEEFKKKANPDTVDELFMPDFDSTSTGNNVAIRSRRSVIM